MLVDWIRGVLRTREQKRARQVRGEQMMKQAVSKLDEATAELKQMNGTEHELDIEIEETADAAITLLEEKLNHGGT